MSEAKKLNKLHIRAGSQVLVGMDNWTMDEFWEHHREGNHFDKWDRIVAKDVFQRVEDPLRFMNYLFDFARHNARLALETPYGSSDAASEDLEARRLVFKETYRAFWPRWRYANRVFYLDSTCFNDEAQPEQVGMAVAQLRNVVKSFAVELVCQKGTVPMEQMKEDPLTTFKYI